MKSQSKLRVASAVVALVLGIMSMVAAIGVLSGKVEPDYAVLQWLVTYNGIMGALAVVVAFGLWRDHPLARHAAGLMLATHLVLLIGLGILRTTGETVANQSFMATVFRIVVWVVILTLAKFAIQKKSGVSPAATTGP